MLTVRPGERKMVFAAPGRGVWGCKSMLGRNSSQGLRKLPERIFKSLPLTLKGSIVSHPDGYRIDGRMVCWVRVAGNSKWFLLRRQVYPNPNDMLSLLVDSGGDIDIIPLGIHLPGYKNSELCAHPDFIPVAQKVLDAIKTKQEFVVPKLGGFRAVFTEEDPRAHLLWSFDMDPYNRFFYDTFAVSVGQITEGANYEPTALLIANSKKSMAAKDTGKCKVHLSLLPDVQPNLLNVLRAIASRELVAYLVD